MKVLLIEPVSEPVAHLHACVLLDSAIISRFYRTVDDSILAPTYSRLPTDMKANSIGWAFSKWLDQVFTPDEQIHVAGVDIVVSLHRLTALKDFKSFGCGSHQYKSILDLVTT